MAFSMNWGPCCGRPSNKSPTIVGFILGLLDFGNAHVWTIQDLYCWALRLHGRSSNHGSNECLDSSFFGFPPGSRFQPTFCLSRCLSESLSVSLAVCMDSAGFLLEATTMARLRCH